MASITSSASDQRLSTSKRHLKPLMTLRDYLLDDLSSCSSNGFKSFPRRQPPPSSSSSTVRRLLDAEIKRSGLIHHQPHRTGRRRNTCGTAISHAVCKASSAFLNAVKLLPFTKQRFFSIRFSKRLSSGHREVKGEGKGEIQWWKSVAYEESLHQPSDLVFQISITTVKEETTVPISEAVITTVEEFVPCDSSSSGSEVFTEVVQSSSSSSSSSFSSSSRGESEEVSHKNDVVEDGNERRERLKSRDGDGSSVNRSNSKECVNEEKEQLSPVSILECPFKDDQDDDEDNKITDQNVARKSKRLNGLVKLKPLDLEKRLENYVEKQEEEESLNRANRLFALVKTRIGETNDLLASHVVDNLLLDYLQEDNIGPKEEILMVKKVEDWVMGRQEMFMSWEVREKREVYVKEMKWGCICGDERQSVVEDLTNGLLASSVDELIFHLALG